MRKVKACVRAIPSDLSRGIHRVAHALEKHKPDWVEIVKEPEQADLWVLHVIGHGSMTEFDAHRARGGRVAMIQYCLQTTEDSRPEAWLPYWQTAEVVMSYYDLHRYVESRGVSLNGVHFYWSSLGVNADVFKPQVPVRKLFGIGTSGYVAETEGVKECHEACQRLGKWMFHLGPDLNIGNHVAYLFNVSDEQLAEFWSQCSFVAGLRRIEGFELPAIEGLCCGSRPIMFDAPHYRHWLGEHAEYVPEAGHAEVVDAIEALMRKPVRIVTKAERDEVARRFSWRPIVERFWEGVTR